MEREKFETVDQYIKNFPQDVQANLEKIRKTIKQVAPEAEEVISYSIPAYKYHGFLVYLSAYTHHYSLAFPPILTVFAHFKKELAPYKLSKSTVQFPADQPIPFDLITEMVKYGAKENEARENK